MRTVIRHRLPIYLLLLVVILMPGCNPIELPEQTYRDSFVSLTPYNNVGQSFVARFDGLDGFGIYLTPDYPGEGKVILSLSLSPSDNLEVIDRSIIPFAEIDSPGYHFFPFNPQKNSTNQNYYISLEVEGEGSFHLNTGSGRTYLNGALYQNDYPQDAQMTFNLSYDPLMLSLGLLEEVLNWLYSILISVWLFILPGWAFLNLVQSEWRKTHWAIKIGLSAGVSLAVYPMLFLWTDLVGLHLGVVYAWVLPTLGLAVLIWNRIKVFRNIKDKTQYISEQKSTIIQKIKSPNISLLDLLLFVILILIITTRFWAIRNIDLPMWGDSYQHTMIVQLFLDNGGLFQSWLPYTALDTFTYHFGFHANAVVFSWITGKPAAESVLWTGQIINILAVLTLLPLAVKIGKSPWAGVFSLLIAGLLIEMPAYYLNWGRYTQLTGQAILLTVVYFAWLLLEDTRFDWKLLVLNWLVAGGLALTHYRVVIFAILFLPAFWLLHLRRYHPLLILRNLILYGLGSGILFLPWLFTLSKGKIPGIFKRQITISPQDVGSAAQTIKSIGSLDQYLPIAIWVCFLLSFGWLLWKKSRGAALIGSWWGLNLIFTNPGWLGLPGSSVISNFALFIAAYIPATLIISIAISTFLLSKKVTEDISEPGLSLSKLSPEFLLILTLVIGFSLWGTFQQRKIADPYLYALATRPDVIAAEWINANIEDDSRFLINSFAAFKNTEAAGSDGGWWLPLLSGRQTFITPITSGFEQVDTTQNSAEVEIVRAIDEKGLDDPGVLELLSEQGLSHVYIGQRQGLVNTSKPLLDIEILRNSPYYQESYHQDLVWVFEIQYGAEGQ